MNAYAPASSVGWLDFDTTASEKVGTLLRSLEEPGTLDVLGLGAVRDAFSEMLSPGTSTIQTRLRYFIFLPWIFSRLETQHVPPSEFASKLREDEARLIDCLRHLGPNQGVIGYNAGHELKRMPSAVYWGGLGIWGLRRLNLSLTEYGQQAVALGRQRPERDDDENATKRRVSMWASIPPPPDDFLQNDVTFNLSQDEAKFLVDHIQRHHKGTLLAVMCGMADAPTDVDYPWDLPTDGLPEQLMEVLRHARCFSELTVGPQHVYNMLLARKAREEFGWDTFDLEKRELTHLDDWVHLIGNRYEGLRSWINDLPEFWNFLANHGVSGGTQEFITGMVARAVDNPAGFAEDPTVHRRICDREIRLKSKRSRLAHRGALENWNQEPVGGQLNYRWPITKSYLADIAAARPGA